MLGISVTTTEIKDSVQNWWSNEVMASCKYKNHPCFFTLNQTDLDMFLHSKNDWMTGDLFDVHSYETIF